MKYLKTFESHKIDSELAQEIAEIELPKLEEKRQSGENVTTEWFEDYITKEKNLDSHSAGLIINTLVSMGFDFDSDEYGDEDIEPGDYVSFKEHGPLYVVTVLGDGYLVTDDESQRYEGDNGDGYRIPLNSKGTILEKG